MRTIHSLSIAALLAILLAPAVASAQGNAKEIMSKKPAELIEILKDSNATTFEKAKACQRLAVVGTKDAVPALAALLPNEKLNVYARTALENIPGPEGDEALREATKTLKGRPLVGAIDSLGQMRDAKAVALLGKFLEDEDTTVASAAAGALGRNSPNDAQENAERMVMMLTEKSPIQNAIADSFLVWADYFAAEGKTEDASGCFAIFVLPPEGMFDFHVPKHIRAAGIGGFLCTKAEEVNNILLEQINSTDKTFFNVGLAAARKISGKDVAKTLTGELEKLPAERRALLLLAIADRKDQPPLNVYIRESKNESEEVRKAAVYALTQRGDAEAAKALIDIALGEGTVAEAAKDGLIKIPGKEINATIVEKYASADAHGKVVLLDLFGDRGITDATPTVRKALDDPDQAVRLAALAAMSKLIEVNDLDLLIVHSLATDKSKEETAAARSALELAVQRMGDRDATAARLASHIDASPAEQQSLLFDLLCKASGKKALEEVVARTKSNDPAQKDSATRVLGEWVNTDAGPALLEIVKSDPEKKYQIRALRGYIRIARQLEIPWWKASDAPAVKLRMYDEAIVVAQRSEEKILALDILTRIPSPDTLDRAVKCLADSALKEKAAATAVAIAGQVLGHNPKVVAAAMQKVIDVKPEGKTVDQARQLLERAGGGK
ncbi:MAG: hypothetical protein JW959_10750 [Pirellulales bacterium]|nr:hypothetical protein [Pirellulales bacterium]